MIKKWIGLFVLIGMLLLLIRPVAAQQTLPASPKPVVIDTDMALDDWMAILYLLQRSDVNVMAVTVVGTGEAHCNPGVQNAMNLVALAGHPDIPVACGRETPLQGSNTFPQEWRDSMDAMAGLTLAVNSRSPVDKTAVELLSQTINASDEKVTLLTLGPLTNIAELLQTDPKIVDRLAMIDVMGGAVDAPGNVLPFVTNDFAEWNIYVDPLAAAQVVQSGAPITFVALDATNHVPMNMDFYHLLGSYRTTAEAEFAYQALTTQLDFIQSGGYFFWDPLAALTASDGSIISVQGRPVKVVTEVGSELGRIKLDAHGNSVSVAVDADRDRFEQIFLNVLNGYDPSAELPKGINQAAVVFPVTTRIESTDDLAGLWLFQSATTHLQLRRDGTYEAYATLADMSSGLLQDEGTYQLKESVITLTSGKSTIACKPGDVGVFQVYLTAVGQLAFVRQQPDACTARDPGTTAPLVFDSVSTEGALLTFPTGTFITDPYSLTLKADGSYTFGTTDGQVLSMGAYAIKGDQFMWLTDNYCAAPATYTWSFKNDSLSLVLVGEDPCTDRASVLTMRFARQSETAASIAPVPGDQVAQSANLPVTANGQPQNVTLNYLLYLPVDYTKTGQQKWPLVLFLHGYGERGSNLNQLKVHGVPKLISDGQDFPFIAIAPQLPITQYTWADQDNQLAALIENLQSQYRIDASRIYIMGISLGGNGTWQFALTHPDIPAAIVPIAGWYGTLNSTPEVPANICSLKNMPIWVFHGTADTTVLPSNSQGLVNALQECGSHVIFTQYPGADHSKTFDLVDATPELFDWLLAQHK